jgi:endonuclease/exonuclease/phosphatase family metal-dependent hydrolase
MNGPPIKCVSFNLHGWRDKKTRLSETDISKALVALRADILLLNEVKTPFPSCRGILSPRMVTLRHGGKKYSLVFSGETDDTNSVRRRICALLDIGLDSEIRLVRESDNVEMIEFGNLPDQSRPDDKSGKYAVKVLSERGEKALNTVSDALEMLARDLGMRFAFFPAMDASFGNAILWKDSGDCKTYCKEIAVSGEETRSVGALLLKGRNFFVTHLDHKREATRVAQLTKVLDFIREHHSIQLILGGDLNALDLSDYDSETNQQIAHVREQGNWEKPEDHLVRLLQGQGWTDCWKQKHSAVSNPSTCEYGTRIDYIWTDRPETVVSCDIQRMKGSDHDAVVCEFSF